MISFKTNVRTPFNPICNLESFHSLFQPATRALMGPNCSSPLRSAARAIGASSSEIRALMGSRAGLAERDMLWDGTARVSPLRWGVGAESKSSSSWTESRFLILGSICRKPCSFATFSMLLKYYARISSCGKECCRSDLTLTVFTLSSSVASSSMTIIGCGCS